jgi:hypothetical protein
MDSLLAALAGMVSLPVLLLVLFLIYPEKVEKWWAIILKVLVRFRAQLHRRQVTHELQGRVNDFVRRMRKAITGFDPPKLRVEWVEPGETRKAFVDRDGDEPSVEVEDRCVGSVTDGDGPVGLGEERRELRDQGELGRLVGVGHAANVAGR